MSAKENFIINSSTNEIQRSGIKTVDISKDTNIEISNYSNDAKIIIAYYEGSVNNG